jgi:hypothetical protein
MGWDSQWARDAADEKAARAAAKPAPSKQAIRNKLRAHEGMAHGRPQTADTSLGLTDTDEMMRLRAASVAARLRPSTADGKPKATKASAQLQVTHSSDAVRSPPCSSFALPVNGAPCRSSADRVAGAVQFLNRQSGFIPTDHGFLHADDPGRGRRRKPLAHELELAGRVEKTLSEVKSSYFPRSKNWSVRAKLGDGAAPDTVDKTTQSQRRVAGGSFVVYQGQTSKLKKRNENQYRQMALLQQGCVLTETECAKLREQFTKTSNGENPTITFSRFLQVRSIAAWPFARAS